MVNCPSLAGGNVPYIQPQKPITEGSLKVIHSFTLELKCLHILQAHDKCLRPVVVTVVYCMYMHMTKGCGLLR